METTVFFYQQTAAGRSDYQKQFTLPENVKRVEVIAVGRTRNHYACRRDMDEMVLMETVSALDFMDNRKTTRHAGKGVIRCWKFMLDTNILHFHDKEQTRQRGTF